MDTAFPPRLHRDPEERQIADIAGQQEERHRRQRLERIVLHHDCGPRPSVLSVLVIVTIDDGVLRFSELLRSSEGRRGALRGC